MLGPTLRFTRTTSLPSPAGDMTPLLDEKAHPHGPGHPGPVRFCPEAAGCPHRLPDLCGLCRWAGIAGGHGQPCHRGPEPGGRTGGPPSWPRGDEIPFLAPKTALPPAWRTAGPATPCLLGRSGTCGSSWAPQDDAFTQQGLDTFLGQPYQVTNDFDRMGLPGRAGHPAQGGRQHHLRRHGQRAIQVPTSGCPSSCWRSGRLWAAIQDRHCDHRDLPLSARVPSGDHLSMGSLSLQAHRL